MLPKLQQQAYVGFDKGSKSVKYYNAAIRNILTSRNFWFLTPVESTPPEEITIKPDTPLEGERIPLCEGKLEDGTHSTAPANTRKRKASTESIDPREPRKMRGIQKNYKYLNDPFPDEKEVGMVSVAREEVFTIIPRDNCHSLKEARASQNWLE